MSLALLSIRFLFFHISSHTYSRSKAKKLLLERANLDFFVIPLKCLENLLSFVNLP